MDDIEIRALEPGLLEDYLYFMEHDAFSGNPDWVGCFCLEGHTTGAAEEEDDEPIEVRRERITGLIRAGEHHGLLAYRGGKLVGWSHATPLRFLQYEEYRLGRDDAEAASIGSIVCFNLAESVRREGLPGVLLREALKRFANAGLTHAEAYPWKDPAPRPNRNYLGTVHLYELHGFERAGESGDAFVMRRPLTKERPIP